MRLAFYILAIVSCVTFTGCDIEVDAHAASIPFLAHSDSHLDTPDDS